eukprot:g44166.t1
MEKVSEKQERTIRSLENEAGEVVMRNKEKAEELNKYIASGFTMEDTVFFEKVTKKLDKQEPVDMIYLDFKKAFAKVLHRKLLNKEECFSIGGGQKFARMILEKKGLAYEEWLRALGLYLMEFGRMRGDLFETYKIHTGRMDVEK